MDGVTISAKALSIRYTDLVALDIQSLEVKGGVIALLGHNGAGKSTLAESLRGELSGTLNAMPLMLDGDRLRGGLCLDLGFSDADRAENLRRAAEVARLGVESGHVVIAAFITSREENRLMIEKIIGKEWISLIHVDASLDVCRERDVKGLYARALTGEVQWMRRMIQKYEAAARDSGARIVHSCGFDSIPRQYQENASFSSFSDFARRLGISRKSLIM